MKLFRTIFLTTFAISALASPAFAAKTWPLHPLTNFPISIKCPSENKGVLELITKSDEEIDRIRVKFVDDKALIYTFDVAAKGSSNFNANKNTTSNFVKGNIDVRPLYDAMAERIVALKQNVCNGSESAKVRYLQYLEANKIALKTGVSLVPIDENFMETPTAK